MKSYVLCIAILISYTITYSQEQSLKREDSLKNAFITEGYSKELALETLTYIHYEGVKSTNRPNCALFFINQEGECQLETNRFWELENSAKIVLEKMNFISSCNLVNEIKFKSLDLDWINLNLQSNLDSNHANFIYYNSIDSLGFLRVYRVE